MRLKAVRGRAFIEMLQAGVNSRNFKSATVVAVTASPMHLRLSKMYETPVVRVKMVLIVRSAFTTAMRPQPVLNKYYSGRKCKYYS